MRRQPTMPETQKRIKDVIGALAPLVMQSAEGQAVFDEAVAQQIVQVMLRGAQGQIGGSRDVLAPVLARGVGVSA